MGRGGEVVAGDASLGGAAIGGNDRIQLREPSDGTGRWGRWRLIASTPCEATLLDGGVAALTFTEGNKEHLPFADGAFDVYTIAFGLCNNACVTSHTWVCHCGRPAACCGRAGSSSAWSF